MLGLVPPDRRLEVRYEELAAAPAQVPAELQAAIRQAARNIESFHRQQQEAEAETRWDLAEQILNGEMTLEDLPDDMGAYTSFAIEDYTTQVGQGPVRGRGQENLAPTDTRLVMMRRLWTREVSALAADQPLTDWKIPTQPLSEGV